jgi:hypothetical protein
MGKKDLEGKISSNKLKLENFQNQKTKLRRKNTTSCTKRRKIHL